MLRLLPFCPFNLGLFSRKSFSSICLFCVFLINVINNQKMSFKM